MTIAPGSYFLLQKKNDFFLNILKFLGSSDVFADIHQKQFRKAEVFFFSIGAHILVQRSLKSSIRIIKSI